MAKQGESAAGLGRLEAEVMAVLWRSDGPLLVRQVAAALNSDRAEPLAYTTVMTVMSRLADKGLLSRSRSGRRFVYTPAAADTAEAGWPLPTGYDSANAIIVLAAAATGVAASGSAAARIAAGSRALRTLLRAARQPVPPVVLKAAAGLGIADLVDAVGTGEAFAVTYRLIRPRILVSTALAAELTAAEVDAAGIR